MYRHSELHELIKLKHSDHIIFYNVHNIATDELILNNITAISGNTDEKSYQLQIVTFYSRQNDIFMYLCVFSFSLQLKSRRLEFSGVVLSLFLRGLPAFLPDLDTYGSE